MGPSIRKPSRQRYQNERYEQPEGTWNQTSRTLSRSGNTSIFAGRPTPHGAVEDGRAVCGGLGCTGCGACLPVAEVVTGAAACEAGFAMCLHQQPGSVASATQNVVLACLVLNLCLKLQPVKPGLLARCAFAGCVLVPASAAWADIWNVFA